MNKPKRLLLTTCVCLLLSAYGTLTKFRDRQSIEELCNEEALQECPPLSKPAATEFDTAVNWGLMYSQCQLKHRILLHCVEEHGTK